MNLPVLQSCGQCGYAQGAAHIEMFCAHPANGEQVRKEIVYLSHFSEPPPKECPLRDPAWTWERTQEARHKQAQEQWELQGYGKGRKP